VRAVSTDGVAVQLGVQKAVLRPVLKGTWPGVWRKIIYPYAEHASGIPDGKDIGKDVSMHSSGHLMRLQWYTASELMSRKVGMPSIHGGYWGNAIQISAKMECPMRAAARRGMTVC